MLTNMLVSAGYRLRASIVLLNIVYLAGLSGCKSTAPAGRCGLPDLCSPTVMNDPFPCDQNVPPKGVDVGHYGYTRPQWHVLTSQQPPCCVIAESVCTAPMVQTAPVVQTAPMVQTAPSEPAPVSVHPTENALPSITPAPQYTLSGYLKPSVTTTEIQPYPHVNGFGLIESIPLP